MTPTFEFLIAPCWNKKEIAIWAERVKSPNYSVLQSELIAGVRRAVELHYDFSLRDTQLLSLLTLLNPDKNMGRLAQINTGEGKSLIVAMLAAIHALQGKKVDVITTSTELSIPEVIKQTSFFNSLSLTVAKNSNKESKLSAYKSDVLYGASCDFQADILQTEVLGRDIRENRRFDIVNVDEVDSMLFDNHSHSVRLSEQTPGYDPFRTSIEEFKRNGKEITLYSDKDWESCAVAVTDKRSFITEQTQCHLKQLLRELDDEETV